MNPFRVRERLEAYRVNHPVDWSLLEQDYALSWMLYGITQQPDLFDHLIFKGGTCLKKCFFGDYRFSQDLDFSVREGCPQGDALDALIQKACATVTTILHSTKNNVTFTSKRYVEKRPHPDNQEAFSIAVQYPWQREPLTRIMVEITFSEVVYLRTPLRDIIHDYGDEVKARVWTYALEEVLAEKVAALVSFSTKLHERGWARSRARDYYDLWRVLTTYRDTLDTSLILPLATKKCARKKLTLQGLGDIFAPNLMEDLDTAWEQWVKPLTVSLPPKNQVIEELKEAFHDIGRDRIDP